MAIESLCTRPGYIGHQLVITVWLVVGAVSGHCLCRGGTQLGRGETCGFGVSMLLHSESIEGQGLIGKTHGTIIAI